MMAKSAELTGELGTPMAEYVTLVRTKNTLAFYPLSLAKMSSGANAFEISDIQDDEIGQR
jgi:hypothetical protein